jgi:hypothetical protein
MADYHGDTYLFQGLSSLGNKLGNALEKRQEDEKNRAREFKALSEYADASGLLNKDQAQVMDLDSLRGFIKGKIYEEEDSRKRMDDVLKAEHLNQYLKQNESQAALAEMAKGYGHNVMNQYYEEGDASQPFPSIADALANNPNAINAPNFASMLHYLPQANGAGMEPKFIDIPGTGHKAAYIPGHGGLNVVPKAPEAGPTEPVPQVAPDGTVLGHMINVGGKPRFVKAPADTGNKYDQLEFAKRLAIIGEREKYDPDGFDSDKAIEDLRREFDARKPKAKAEAPKIVRVQSPDGKTGTIPADKLEAALKQGYKKLE